MNTKQAEMSVITSNHRRVLLAAFALAISVGIYLSLRGDTPLESAIRTSTAEVWAWAGFNGGWLLFCFCENGRARRVAVPETSERNS